MDLKLDEEGLYEVETIMEKDSEDLDAAIRTITDALEELRGIWEGQDADKFFNNAREYFERMRGIPMCMRNMGKFMNKANRDLTEKDAEFSKELETEVSEDYMVNTGSSSGISKAVSTMKSSSSGNDTYQELVSKATSKSSGTGSYQEVSSKATTSSGKTILDDLNTGESVSLMNAEGKSFSVTKTNEDLYKVVAPDGKVFDDARGDDLGAMFGLQNYQAHHGPGSTTGTYTTSSTMKSTASSSSSYQKIASLASSSTSSGSTTVLDDLSMGANVTLKDAEGHSFSVTKTNEDLYKVVAPDGKVFDDAKGDDLGAMFGLQDYQAHHKPY